MMLGALEDAVQEHLLPVVAEQCAIVSQSFLHLPLLAHTYRARFLDSPRLGVDTRPSATPR